MIVSNVPLRAVLWDFDGVLNNNAPGGQFLWSKGFEDKFGAPIDDFTDAVFGGLEGILTGAEDIFDRIDSWITGTGADTTPEAVVEHWLEHDFYPNVRIQAAIGRMAKKGLRQAILTNADTRRAAWVDGLLRQFPGIEQVFASARIGHAKPAPEAFQAVLDAMELDPGEVMFIDDSSTNVNAAGAMGFRTFRYSLLAHDALEWTLPK